jgi:hypothetical protein
MTRTAIGIAAFSLMLSCLRLAVDDDQAWSCGDDGPCPEGRVCKGSPEGTCLRPDECREASHCDSGRVCNDERCEEALPPATPPRECWIDGDCDEGESCLDTRCSPCEPDEEVCNGVDDDCDREIDEDFEIGYLCVAQGDCAVGRYECSRFSDYLICSTDPGGSEDASSPEVCDGRDNDCNGLVDDLPSLVCCNTTINACVNGIPQSCPDPNTVSEICDGLDNDCDGLSDEDIPTTQCCAGVIATCVFGVQQLCPGPDAVADVCDGADNDCDGLIDEDPDQWASFGPGVATDLCNRTSWQSASSGAAFTYAEAEAYCAALLLDGYEDWSLPTLADYLAIVDCEPDTSCPGCSSHTRCEHLFHDDTTGFYWGKRESTLSPFVTLDFGNGEASTISFEETAAQTRAAARCVRYY